MNIMNKYMLPPMLRVVLPLALFSSLACSGELPGGGPTDNAGAPGLTNAGAGGGGNPPVAGGGAASGLGGMGLPIANPDLKLDQDPKLAEAPVPESAGPLNLRRLDAREYSNTLRDWFGVENAGADLPFEPNLASGFVVVESASAGSVRVFMDVAEELRAAGKFTADCDVAADEQGCATTFITDFGRKVFRRPTKATEREHLLGLFQRARELDFTPEEAIGFVGAAMLQSSGFLYLWEVGDEKPVAQDGLIPLTPHQVASRLSYLLVGTAPDDQLSQAADAGALSTPEQVAVHADRLLSQVDDVTETLEEFYLQWLHLDNLGDLQKDTSVYPQFTEQFRAALAPELVQFVRSVVLEGDGTLKTLFTSREAYPNAELAGVYGAAPGQAGAPVQLDPAQRSGLLTQAAFLASNATQTASLPPRRGKVMFEQVLCGVMPPVPGNVPPVNEDTPGLTTRERFALHSEMDCAKTCHGVLDPLGFAFESYDAIGAYRETEVGKPVDSSGRLVTPAGAVVEFNNAVELLGALSESFEVERCATRQWFRYMLKRRELPADEGSIEAVYRAAGAGPDTDLSLRTVLREMVTTKAFLMRAPAEGEL